jgi:hypothetical protein
MSVKELNINLTELFKNHTNKKLTYESITELFDKQITTSNAKKNLRAIEKI